MDDLLVTRAPHWGWHAVLYFFVGGIAGGSYVLATAGTFLGTPHQRAAARRGFLVAFPAVVVGGLILVLDLTRPERFWHMLLLSERPGIAFKAWSPISFGAWGLLVFGAFALASFVGVLAEARGGRLAGLAQGRLGRGISAAGSVFAFFVAGYTGALLATTNRPVWAETAFLGPLFLVSAVSTSAAVLVLLAPHGHGARWLARLDLWMLAGEVLLLACVALTLGPALRHWANGWGIALALAAVVPLALHLASRRRALAAAAAAVVGGLVLRTAVVLSVEGL